ncbi:hypothetical protein [Dichotomicrobium thermohalophilum]|uniref:Universal stress protein family protein n=1 Tax=Dichotomicrobium thermohalophilum TaxID=933063 RepID=A0A397Q3S2_9HYPH|nr:hypothetical protein [Dichotomicrobium thermohalophilum]RIA56006.1 hypothetical protein BXY53_1097 [Dichotomicrobium thermohalophilum]
MTVTIHTHHFRRLILGLSPGSRRDSAETAADLARLLDVELFGLFLEDAGLRELGNISVAREFRPLGGGWRPIRAEQMARDLDEAAREAERAFFAAAHRMARRHQFEVRRGPIADAIASLSETNDIVMISEPGSAAERATAQFSALVEAAFRSSAAVLLVPTEIARRTGPVVAIAAKPDDPCIQTAAGIAAMAGEPLVVLQAYDGATGGQVDVLAGAGLTVRAVQVGAAGISDPVVCVEALALIGERLMVMSHTHAARTFAPAMLAARRVPVLVLEPERGESEPAPVVSV